MQKTEYKGTDLMLFSNTKFFDDILIEYFGEDLEEYINKLFDFILLEDLTSIEIISSLILVIKSNFT